MPRLLHIQSSPNLDASVSRVLSQKFVDTWVANHPSVEVDVLDLAVDAPPHFGPAIMAAGGTPPEQWSPETQEAVALSGKLVDQLEAADIVVIAAPMYNFTICSQLKGWIDHVTVAGRTFQYSAPGVVKGLLFGKKVFVVATRGGDYTDFPMNGFDHQEPLLKANLGFLGLFDVNFIRAQGMRQTPEETDAIMRNAESIIANLAS
jgi:FMN-dependent NADH-azoreductase